MNSNPSEADRDDRLASVAAKILEQIDRGEPGPSRTELARLYPDLVDELAAFLEDDKRGLVGIDMNAVNRFDEDSTRSQSPSDPDGETVSQLPTNEHPISPAVPGYEVLDELGRGGMGVVYKARQVKAGRLVALKVVRSGIHASPAELARFRTEAEAIARLAQANVVQVFEVGEHDGLPFFSMELCTGGSLSQRLAGNPMDPAEAAC